MKITVIGAGPGGYEAAIAAAKRGTEVTIIEKNAFGGTCLNRGCIPTKAYLASADVYEAVKHAADYGVKTEGGVALDAKAVYERKNKVVSTLVKGIGVLFEKNNIRHMDGFGKLVDKHTIEVAKDDGTTETVASDYIILATGSVPVCPKMFGYDGKRVITSDEVLDFDSCPKSIVIVGGGVIGCEIGQYLATAGADVTIVEMLPKILPNMDEDVSKQLLRQFKKDKIKVITGDGIAQVAASENGVGVTLQSGKALESEYLLVAIGRRPYTDGLGLENAGIEKTQRGFVATDAYLKTSCENIYAIGDIVDSPMLAHIASKEGLTAVENIFGGAKKADYKAVPGCVYTQPEIASVGKTESELTKAGVAYKTGTFDMRGLGKAQASGQLSGFVKIITDENDVIVGGGVSSARTRPI
jgi:dihydrolipoamide dehydrogenase